MKTIFISRNREQLGQFSEEEVKSGLQTGRFRPDDLAWKEGMDEWQPLSTFNLGTVAPKVPLYSGEVAGSVPGPDETLLVAVFHVQIPAAAVAGDFPWEDKSLGFMARWWGTTKGTLFAPIKTFGAMPVTGGYGNPILFYLVGALLGGLVVGVTQVLLQTFVLAASGSADAAAAGGASLLCALPIAVGSILVGSAIGVLIGAFLGGGIIHLLLMIFGGAKNGYEASVRAVCYAGGAIGTMQVVPLLGWLAASIWGPIIYVIALKEAHKTDYWRVILAVLVPVVVCCGFVIFLAIAIPGIIAASGGQIQ